MKFCAVCLTNVEHAFKAPVDSYKRKRWSDACGTELTEMCSVCDKHFSPDSFMPSGRLKRLYPGALPNEEIVSCVVAAKKYDHVSEDTPANTALINNNVKHENEYLKTNNEILAKENRRLQKMLNNSYKIVESLKVFFTDTQIIKLKTGHTICWTPEDMRRAEAIYRASDKAYRLLLTQGLPFPPESEMRKLCCDIGVEAPKCQRVSTHSQQNLVSDDDLSSEMDFGAEIATKLEIDPVEF